MSEPTPEPTPTPEPEPTPEPKPEPNPLEATVSELQAKLDALAVEKDKALADSAAKLDEMQRRYEIAVKTGTKTGPQTGPNESANPVLDAINRRFPAKT